MKIHIGVLSAALLFSVAAGSAFGAEADANAKRAEVRKATQTSLERFYKANPTLKGEVAKAPGYAVFTTYGITFLIGGSGGTGLAHDNKSNKDTYMSMASASVGVQLGASQTEVLIVFKTPAALTQFVDKGWELGGSAEAGAGAGGKSVGKGVGENVIADALYYTMTKNGLQAGGAVAGTKFWKSGDLN